MTRSSAPAPAPGPAALDVASASQGRSGRKSRGQRGGGAAAAPQKQQPKQQEPLIDWHRVSTKGRTSAPARQSPRATPPTAPVTDAPVAATAPSARSAAPPSPQAQPAAKRDHAAEPAPPATATTNTSPSKESKDSAKPFGSAAWSSRGAADARRHAVELADSGMASLPKGDKAALQTSRGPYCPCMATTHGLWTNCMACGKVLCDREAGRVCTACGTALEHVAPGRKAILEARQRAAELTSSLGAAMLCEHQRATATGRTVPTASPAAGRPEDRPSTAAGGGAAAAAAAGTEAGGASAAAAAASGPKVDDSAAQAAAEVDEDDDVFVDEDAAGGGGGAAPMPDALRRAIEHKNRLLGFDRSSEARTQVFDDQADYFGPAGSGGAGGGDVWLSASERDSVRKAEAERRDRLHSVGPMTMQIEVDMGAGTVRLRDADADRKAAVREELAASVRDSGGKSAWQAAQEQGAKSAAERIRKREEDQARAREMAAAGASASGLETSCSKAAALSGRAAEVYRSLLSDAAARKERRLGGTSASGAAGRGVWGANGSSAVGSGARQSEAPTSMVAALGDMPAAAGAGVDGPSDGGAHQAPGHPTQKGGRRRTAGLSESVPSRRTAASDGDVLGFTAAAFGGSSVLQHADPLDTSGAAGALRRRRADDRAARAAAARGEVAGGQRAAATAAAAVAATDASEAAAGLVPREVRGYGVASLLSVASAVVGVDWHLCGNAVRLASLLESGEDAVGPNWADAASASTAGTPAAAVGSRLIRGPSPTPEALTFAAALQQQQLQQQERGRAGDAARPGTPGAAAAEGAPASFAAAARDGPGPLSDAVSLPGEQPASDARAAGSGGAAVALDQPWASLVVSGLKRFVGASWRTSHRGRVWVISTPRRPSQADIDATLLGYKQMLPSVDLPLPDSFPSSALLGAVDVAETLSMDEYRSRVIDATEPREHSQPLLWRVERPHVLPSPVILPRVDVIAPTGRASIPAASMRHAASLLLVPDRALETAPGSLVPVNLAFRPARSLKPLEAAGARSAATSGSVGDRGLGTFSACPSYDISSGSAAPWPASATGPSLTALDVALEQHAMARWPRPRKVELAMPGVVVLRDFVPEAAQMAIAKAVAALGAGDGGFPAAITEGCSVRCRTMHLGQSWNPRLRDFEPRRSHMDNAPAPALPSALQRLAREVATLAATADPACAGARDPSSMAADICECSFFEAGRGSTAPHQSTCEGPFALRDGAPLVTVSVGATAELEIFDGDPKAAGARPRLFRLASGDVLVMGGPARQLYHGIRRVLPRTGPRLLALNGGRLSVCMRDQR